MRLDLVGGSDSRRSVIANAQRCVNYYPEPNRQDGGSPFTYYQRAGLRALTVGSAPAPVRGLWPSSDGQGWAVIGDNVYSIGSNWSLTLVGTLQISGLAPISAVDNGTDMLLVDSTSLGYTINLASHAFAAVNDPTGTFNGATRVDTLDTFILWNIPGTKQFGSTLSNEITFDALYIAGKATYADFLQTLIVNRREIILLGTYKSEMWYDAGNPLFPFAELPGMYIEHGCEAPYSVASNDIETFWLHQDLQGRRLVLSVKGYDVKRISNFALEFALGKMNLTSDAIGWTFQRSGHSFYSLTFPSSDQTWVYDITLGDDPTLAWHQEGWSDPNDGRLHRVRGRSAAYIYGLNVVGDHTNGTIYALDETRFTDEVGGTLGPIACIKGFPHVMSTLGPAGQMDANSRTITHKRFVANLESGTGAYEEGSDPPQITLRYSNDRGKTWVNTQLASAGAEGEFETFPFWVNAGIARDMVYEIEHSINGPAALNGAWVDVTPNNQ